MRSSQYECCQVIKLITSIEFLRRTHINIFCSDYVLPSHVITMSQYLDAMSLNNTNEALNHIF